MTRHFLRDDDLSPAEQHEVLSLAASLKQAPFDSHSLSGPRTVATIYDKPTLRTQASFAAGIAELGGNPMLVDGSLAGIGKRESVADVARVLGRQASLIVWRTYAQSDLDEMAEHAGVPVINALTDEFHPCQVLADLLTIRERKGEPAGHTVAFVGDGACNMGNSWLLAGATAGLHVRIAAPEGHQPEEQYVVLAREIGGRTGASVQVMTDPRAAVAGADVVVTDTWVSMGREEEAADRLAAFAGYTVTADLMSLAALDAIVLHCLDGPQSMVWDEAENRRHVQKAIITWLLGDTGEATL